MIHALSWTTMEREGEVCTARILRFLRFANPTSSLCGRFFEGVAAQ
jgi:hypothetical protein